MQTCTNMTSVMSNVRKILRQTKKTIFSRIKAESWREHNRNLSAETLLRRGVRSVRNHPFSAICIVLATGSGYLSYRYHQSDKLRKEANTKRRTSEKAFIEFASVEYNGQIYMTPLDFLHCVLEPSLTLRRKQRASLNDDYMEQIRQKTPSQDEGSPHFFSNLGIYGIISYSEYLFLLSVLVKPYSAFKMTFQMLDTDSNQTIDKQEYLVMERIFSRRWKQRRGLYKSEEFPQIRDEELVNDELGLQRQQLVDTTLMTYFFGQDGTQTLSYDTFEQFLLNVQQEILEMEFALYSHGLPFITELDFAKLLIRYSYFDAQYDYHHYIDRLLARPEYKTPQPGISLEEFTAFMEFLHKMDDFYFALKYYTQVNPKASRGDFHNAFKMLKGHNLTDHLIDTIFNIFDVDNTGFLVYQDFIQVINDRLHRGFQKRAKSKWQEFKCCLRRSMEKESRGVKKKRKKMA